MSTGIRVKRGTIFRVGDGTAEEATGDHRMGPIFMPVIGRDAQDGPRDTRHSCWCHIRAFHWAGRTFGEAGCEAIDCARQGSHGAWHGADKETAAPMRTRWRSCESRPWVDRPTAMQGPRRLNGRKYSVEGRGLKERG